MNSNWEDKGCYWVTTQEQLSEFWHLARIGRITGAKIGSLVGHSKFSDPVTTAREISGTYNTAKGFSTKVLMEHGVITEPYARKWFSNHIGKDVVELGLAVPKWNFKFGVSVDGIIDKDCICEIKSPKKMYHPLKDHRKRCSKGEIFDKYFHAHIWDNHYDQMQLGMAVTGARKCYYVVYVSSEEDLSIPQDVYCECILFNVEYWNKIYTVANKKYDELIAPIMKEYNIVRIDPKAC